MKSLFRSSGRFLALVAVLAWAITPASAQGFKWWHDDGYRRELGLTTEQSARLEEIFQKASPTLRQQKEALDRAQAQFDDIVEGSDDRKVMEQLDTLEHARAELNKARVMMLLRMRRTLTADQWVKFTVLTERDRTARNRAGNR